MERWVTETALEGVHSLAPPLRAYAFCDGTWQGHYRYNFLDVFAITQLDRHTAFKLSLAPLPTNQATNLSVVFLGPTKSYCVACSKIYNFPEPRAHHMRS